MTRQHPQYRTHLCHKRRQCRTLPCRGQSAGFLVEVSGNGEGGVCEGKGGDGEYVIINGRISIKIRVFNTNK